MVITSVLSAGYYLRVLQVMFMRPRAEGAVARAHAGAHLGVIGGAFALILSSGFPEPRAHAAARHRDRRAGVPAAAAARPPPSAPAALAR
jgi:NADH:ubiquinone oxidoreductase subunit 2 (subunit N)